MRELFRLEKGREQLLKGLELKPGEEQLERSLRGDHIIPYNCMKGGSSQVGSGIGVIQDWVIKITVVEIPGNVYDSGPFASGVSLYTSTQRKEKTKEQSLQLRPTGPEI
ncbi:hypothetical protein HGM15179_000606 [Zosterops borbonicus]|uniref:Uncharacterized protein n=1 Tax=Zosterops borbonicus TaxID=364589 RepID=A0A8K1LU70_9PASS|nr:hypothetical protein HGM15179_000606 [Zosterops borbonicus]